MKKILIIILALMLLGTWGLSTSANALVIEVSQESSAGAGDFNANVLGNINPWTTALTTAGFYQYDTPYAASYNGELNGGPNPVSSLSQVFLVNASDGLSLVVVHDKPVDGSGGTTQTRWNLTGDTSAQVLADDPGEVVSVSAGGTQFDSSKLWYDCCTDGYAIGSLDGNWTMYGQFLASPTGINAWSAVSDGSPAIPLVLEVGRRVRLRSVPEPGTLLLLITLFTGLVGLGGFKRKF